MEQYNAIEVKNVTKKFKLYHDKGKMLKERAISWKRNKFEERWVLNGISFSVKKGEAIGLIGHNGCGKSTTLKLLTRIMYPTDGSIEIQGRVSSLLELGAGFHPDLSGRENIYINASIFGLTKREIDKRLDKIIEFSELEEFIDNPVRTYSSGMYMRLAFSVAINVDADVLLIDEILAVGDVNFQSKCFNKLMEIKKKGTTIVLVSHSTDQIEQICERSIWIHEGLIRADGSPRDVHRQYLKFMGEQRNDRQKEESVAEQSEKVEEEAHNNNIETVEVNNTEPKNLKNCGEDVEFKERMRGNGYAKITCINSYDENGEIRSVFETGSKLIFKIKYKMFREVHGAWFGLCIFRNDGFRCYGTNSKVDNKIIDTLNQDGEFEITFPQIGLLPGKYYVDVCIGTREDDMLDYLDTVNDFEIYSTTPEIGLCKMPYEWKFDV